MPLHRELIPYITSLLHTQGKRDLTDKTVLISAGGVKEFFDPVRFIGNPATGKMGLALAQAAVHRGANVILVYGTLPDIPIDGRITKISVTSSAQMQHRENLARERLACRQNMRDAGGQNPRLAGSRPGQNQNRPVQRFDRKPLLRIKPLEIGRLRPRRHRPRGYAGRSRLRRVEKGHIVERIGHAAQCSDSGGKGKIWTVHLALS